MRRIGDILAFCAFLVVLPIFLLLAMVIGVLAVVGFGLLLLTIIVWGVLEWLTER